MYLFIFESLGTSELILIGLVALIVFGPRKLPQMAKTIGKYMAEFRRTTNEFKSTWEKEVNFEEEKKALTQTFEEPDNKILNTETAQITTNLQDAISAPEIKEISAESFTSNEKQLEPANEIQPVNEKSSETVADGKQNWL